MAGKVGNIKTVYSLIGRRMNENKVVGYFAQKSSTNTDRITEKAEDNQVIELDKAGVAYLIGCGRITNCDCQIYNGSVAFKGKGISLNDLPVLKKDGEVSRAENLVGVKKNVAGIDAIGVMRICGSIVLGRNTVGYILKNSGGQLTSCARDTVFEMAQKGLISNARAQMNNGDKLIRGHECAINKLPSKTMEEWSLYLKQGGTL